MKPSSLKLALPPDLQPLSKGNKMRRMLAGLAFASAMTLGLSGAVHAQQMGAYTCTQGGNPPPPGTYPGSLTITEPGACTLGAVSATGSISVGAGGNIILGALNGNGVSVQSTGGSTSVSTINSGSGATDVYGKDANNVNYFDVTLGGTITAGTTTNIVGKNITATVSLASPQISSHGGGTVNLKALTGSPNVTNDSGDINVVGTVGDGTTTSVYMSAGQTIGVGNIKISGTVATTSAALTSVQLLAGGNISTGAITSPDVEVLANKFGITGTSTFLLGGGGTNGISGAVTAKNTTGGGGYIDIENGYQTGTGNMTVTAGDVVETGTTGNFIGLYAHGGTLVLPASKITAGGPLSQALLVGKTVNFVNGTNISSDYLTGGAAHSVAILADTINYAGTSVVTANGSGQDSNDPGAVLVQGYTSGTTKVQFVGTSGAKISLGADGDHTYTQVYADAISFATGAATLHSQGATDHGVYLTNVSDTSANDSLSIPSGSLTLDGSGKNGGGGTVSVDVSAATVNAPTITLNANSGTGSNGNGGTINLTAASFVVGSSNVTTIDAAGDGTGNGGTITINSAGTVDLSNSTINNDGGCSGGNGGTTTISANVLSIGEVDGSGNGGGVACIAIAKAKPELSQRATGNSNGGTFNLTTVAQWNIVKLNGIKQNGIGTGNGGTINIKTGQSVDLSTVKASATIQAMGGPSSSTALGGTVTINNVLGYPTNRLVTDLIQVTGGNALAESAKDGSISLTPEGGSAIVCNQRNVVLASANTTYWDCYDSTLYGSNLTGLSTATQNVYKTAKVRLFLFQNSTDATNFLGGALVSSDVGTLGYSLFAPANFTVVYISGNNVIPATIRHEIGHQADQNASTQVLSQSAYMNDLMNEDWTSFNNQTKNPRCTLFPTVCNTVPYKTESNQQILGSMAKGIPSYFNPTSTTPPGVQWREVFAEEFAIGSGGGYNATIDGWLNYFKCTQTYVTSVYKNGHATAPTYTGYCTTPTDSLP